VNAPLSAKSYADNRICRLLGIELPIGNAAIGTAAGPELAAAVSNAGGLGLIAVSFLKRPEDVRNAIRKVRELTDRPFGVNLLLEWPQEERLQVCLEERVPLISLFWGDPAPFVAAIHGAGAQLMQTVGSVAEAKQAARAGADIVLAQGWEAGGHVRGETSTMCLVPSIVDAVHPLPVAAAGGIADGRGIAAALMLGAEAVLMGTRFVSSHESLVPLLYREAIIAATADDTVFGETFDKGWPNSNMRTLRNSTMAEWIEAGRPAPSARPGECDIVAHTSDGVPIPRYHVTQPHPALVGDQEALALYAGQSAGLVNDVRPAGDIVRVLAADAMRLLKAGGRKRVMGTT
jgi:NAD(P)H-dependent flavin oxidoreductase YrpB (nitropropane dioxygenase family)